MKIKIVKYFEGEARIVMEELPKKTFCFPLTATTKKQDITDELKEKLPGPNTAEEKFNDLNLKSLEGTDI